MANSNSVSSGYRPEMDGPAHEATYRSFTHFTAVGATFVACCVVGLAIGGTKHAWISAVVMIVLAHIATAIGLFSSLAWRAPAVVLALLVLMLIFY